MVRFNEKTAEFLHKPRKASAFGSCVLAEDRSLDLLIRKLDGRVALSEDDKAAIADLPHVLRELPPTAYIVREGEAPGSCSILIKGFAFRQKLAVSGARQIISVHIPGDALDLHQLFLDCADHNVQALTNVTLAVIPRPAMRKLAMTRPVVAQAFAVYNQVEASISREWLLNVGRRDAKTRLTRCVKSRSGSKARGWELNMATNCR